MLPWPNALNALYSHGNHIPSVFAVDATVLMRTSILALGRKRHNTVQSLRPLAPAAHEMVARRHSLRAREAREELAHRDL